MSAYAVIAVGAEANEKQREHADTLAEKLSQRGLDVVVMDNVCHLRSDSPALEALRGRGGPAVFFSLLAPRAALWTLRALGVDVEASERLESTVDGRPRFVFRNLDDRCCPNRWVEAVDVLLRSRWGEMPGTVRRFEPTGEARWFPVIDPDRCTHCLSCLEFCLFGVYDADDQQQLVVREPDACKPGCPACSRVCPSQAIIFPLFQEDPGIAGVEGAEIQPFDPGQLSALKAAYARGELDEDKAKDVLQQKNVCACRLGAPPTHEFDAAIDEALG